MLQVEQDQFSLKWSQVRQQIDAGLPMDGAELASLLDSCADGVSQRTLVAAPLLQLASRDSDDLLRRQAVARLVGAKQHEVQAVLKALPDLTVLGRIEQRRPVIQEAVLGLLPTGDAVAEFLADPTVATAARLHSGGWSHPPGVSPKLAREIRLWVMWTALWRWLNTRNQKFRVPLANESWWKEPKGPPGWEFRVVVAVEQLSRSDLHGALATLALVKSDGTLPPRSYRPFTRMLATFAPLAGRDVELWLAASPDSIPTQQMAIDSLERAAFDFPDLCGPSPARPNARVAQHRAALEASPWLGFSYFTTATAPGVRDAAARALEVQISTVEGAAGCWPWVGREPAFAEAATRLNGDRESIELLAAALSFVQHPSLRQAATAALNTCEPSSLVAVAGSQLAHALQGEFQQLRSSRQQILRRGGIFRAIVDGSNVAWGGKSRKHGARPEIRRVEQVRKELRENGFEEIHLFFDAATRWVNDREWTGWATVAQWQARDEATVVPGVADTHIIAAFMRDPEHSVIVTSDAYRDHLQALPDFRPWAPQCLVKFFVSQDQRIQWARPLADLGYSPVEEKA